MIAAGDFVVYLVLGFIVLGIVGGVMMKVNEDKANTAIRRKLK